MGFAYNMTPADPVEYDEDGLAAPTVDIAAQRRADIFYDAEAEAEAEPSQRRADFFYDGEAEAEAAAEVLAGLEDAEVFRARAMQ